ncbi:Amino acid adenylation domain-containing protein [Sulfidibacter corallicola]
MARWDLDVRGALSEPRLVDALHALVARHEILRTHLARAETAALPLQVVADELDPVLDRLVVDEADGQTFDAALDAHLLREGEGMHTSSFRAFLARMGDGHWRLSLIMPSTHADATTFAILVDDLVAIYSGELPANGDATDEDETEEGELQYADVAEWMHEILTPVEGETAEDRARREAGLRFWTGADWSDGLTSGLTFDGGPTDDQALHTRVCPVPMDEETQGWLMRRTAADPASRDALLLGLWVLMLHRHGEGREPVVALCRPGRTYDGLECVSGLLAKYLPIRPGVPAKRALSGWVEDLAALVRAADDHGEYYDWSRLGLPARGYFATAFESVDLHANRVRPDLVFETVDCDLPGERFGLKLRVAVCDQAVSLALSFDEARFGSVRVGLLAEQLASLIAEARAMPDADLAMLTGLNGAERARILDDFNRHTGEPARPSCFHHLVLDRAGGIPHAPAVCRNDEVLRFGMLTARSALLADRLRRLGVGPDVVVGLMLPRSVDLPVALLAVLRAGGAFLPLDPGLPPGRLSTLVNDARVKLVICDPSTAALEGTAARMLVLGRDLTWGGAGSGAPASTAVVAGERHHSPDQLAYVMYTSGSTGVPKGVMISHRALCNYLEAAVALYRADGDGGAPVFGAFGFDATLTTLLAPWLAGKPIHLLPEDHTLEVLADRLHGLEAFAMVKMTPAHLDALRHLDPAGPSPTAAGALILGGEALLGPALRAWRTAAPATRVFNEYGPTEATVGCCVHEVPPGADLTGPVPIGFPFAGMRLYLLNEALQPVPRGVPGEIYIAGPGLARGYFERPGQTAALFLPDPFATEPGARMYRSGDLARFPLREGEACEPLEFLGRRDHQVKIRGYRIEPDEVSALLRGRDDVAEAHTALSGEGEAEPRLAAWLTPAAGSADALDLEAIGAWLADRLPDYMVPSALVPLATMPLTANGKLDRAALPKPDAGRRARYQSPQTPVEAGLAELWRDLLACQSVGRADHFFRLGGHSLLATRLVSRIRGRFGVGLSLRTLFDVPVLADMAAAIEAAESTELPPIEPCGHDGEAPLSPAQLSMWLVDQKEGASSLYNIPGALKLVGHLDREALAEAFRRLIDRHEALRTRFRVGPDGPLQVIEATAGEPLTFVDLAEAPTEARASRLDELVAAEAAHVFHLTEAPPFRAVLVRLDARDHRLLINLHHIIADGWSIEVMIGELSRCYAALREGREPELPKPALQYADVAVWQNRWLRGEVLERRLDYWREALEGAPELLELPTDLPRPSVLGHRGATCVVTLDRSQRQALDQLCRSYDTTPFTVLLATYAALLGRYAWSDDVVIGTAVANRGRMELEGLVGCLVNTLALRFDLSGIRDTPTLLNRVSQIFLEGYANQQVPLDAVMEAVRPERTLSHAPLFQVVFQLVDDLSDSIQLPDLDVEVVEQPTGLAKWDLLLTAEHGLERTRLLLEYNLDLFQRDTIERMLAHFSRLLTEMARTPHHPPTHQALFDVAAFRDQVREWRHDACPVPRIDHFHDLLSSAAARNGAGTAVIHGDARIGYQALEARANRWAHELRRRGLGAEDLVGLALPRSIDMVTAIFAVMKAGGAYLPLDPDYPAERLRYMVEDAGAALVLVVDAAAIERYPATCTALTAADLDRAAADRPVTAPALRIDPDQLAYVLFTSGSTGRPKGVQVTHRNVANHAMVFGEAFGLEPDSHVYQTSSFNFDMSVGELAMTFYGAATLDLGPAEMLMPSPELTAYLKLQGVTHMMILPFVLPAMGPLDGLDLKVMIVAGASFTRRMLEPLQPGRVVYNGYGPTETTVVSNFYRVREDDGERAYPIGGPVANLTCYVVDRAMNLVPVGVPGELLIGGVQVSRGYRNHPELTATRFIPDPFGHDRGGRLYRTGDLVRYLPDGDIVFMGRIDQQMKVRGFRIEPVEIEQVLCRHEAIADAVVLPRRSRREEEILAAFLVADAAVDGAPAGTELRDFLKQSLPNFMIPNNYVFLDGFPQLPNGKINRQALANWDLGEEEESSRQAPRDDDERVLAEIWAEVLALADVGRDDDFFALGGHSLLATRVMSQVRERFCVSLPVRVLFEGATPAQLADRIRSERETHPTSSEEPSRIGTAEPEDSVPAEADPHELPRIQPVPRDGALPLSFAQNRLWFLEQVEGLGSAYHIHGAWMLDGVLDPSALREAFACLVARHEILRTNIAFDADSGEPVQVIAAEPRFDWHFERLGDAHPTVPEAEARARYARLAARKFDLQRDPLLRVVLLELDSAWHLLGVVMHHIVSDGWSVGLLIRELSEMYADLRAGRAPNAQPLAVQYADFAYWQRRHLAPVLAHQLEYWRNRLLGAPPLLRLPLDHGRQAGAARRGGLYRFRLDAAATADLQASSRRHGTTLFMTCLAAYTALLQRLSGQDDVVVGVPIANRHRAELEPLLGFFVNMLPMRIRLEDDPSAADLLAHVRDTGLEDFAHQDLPFERLVEALAPNRDAAHTPLVQAVFMFQNMGLGDLALDDLTLRPFDGEATDAKFDLSLALHEGTGADGAQELEAEWEYDADLFEAETIRRFAHWYRVLLAFMAASPEQPVSAADLHPERDHLAVAVPFDRTTPLPGSEETLAGRFERQAARTPDAMAIWCEEASWTYAELNAEANRMAHELRALGVGAEVPVGLCIHRSAPMVAAWIAILKIGAVCVPLDPSYPRPRLAYMMGHAGLAAVISRRASAGALPESEVPLLCLDADHDRIQARATTNPARLDHGDMAVYLLYTSGSTGSAKGVVGTHRATLNRIDWMQARVALTPDEVVAQKTALNFVDSVWEIFAPLLHGASLRILPDWAVRDPRELLRYLGQASVTRLTAVPSLLRAMLETGLDLNRALPALRICVSSGETLDGETASALRRRLPRVRLLNLYGSTEVAGDATWFELVDETRDAVPIGAPISHLRAYVLDGRGRAVPPGLPGELWLGGVGLARGYAHMPAHTAERFVPDPFGSRPGARLFRTGDRVRLDGDGCLQFLGRVDHQVKLRGVRIEPGEVEALLRRHPAVASCVVGVTERATGGDGSDAQLVAWWVTRPETEISAAELRVWLRSRLPDFLVPAAYVQVAALPLTPNGKIDRGALPAPEVWGVALDETAPRNDGERKLAEIWAEVIGCPAVGIHANFFDLGGHSLLATRVVARVRERLGRDFGLRDFFGKPTVAEQAVLLAGEGTAPQVMALEGPRPVPRDQPLPLSFAQQRLWFLTRLEGPSATYNMPVALRLRGDLDCAALARAVDGLVARHESLRTIFVSVDDEICQRILTPTTGHLEMRDLSRHEAASREAAWRDLVRSTSLVTFDLERGPLFRAILVAMGDGQHGLLLNLHHIVGDGWSMGVLVRDLMELYRAARAGKPPQLPMPSVAYADFAVWQRAWLQGNVVERQLAYWKDRLGDGIPVLALPTDRPRPPRLSFRGARQGLLLSAELTTDLKALSRREGASLFMVLLATFKLLLSRHSGQDDFAIGSPVAGRRLRELEPIIGFFLNHLVLRTDLRGNPRFVELLARVRETTLAAYENQDVPFERLLEVLRPKRDRGRTSLFQVMFNMLNMPDPEVDLPDLSLEVVETPDIGAKFDLTLYAGQEGDRLQLDLSYNADLFDRDRMVRLLDQYRHLLTQVAAAPELPIDAFSLVTDEARVCLPDLGKALDATWRGSVVEWVARQARQTPDEPAVIGHHQHWRYAELVARFEAVAAALAETGIVAGDVVAILGARDASVVPAVLGTFRAGAVYLLLDPDYPDSRLIDLLEASGARGWIQLDRAGPIGADFEAYLDRAGLAGRLRIADDGLPRQWDDRPCTSGLQPPELEIGPKDPAILTFTSGSTGKPKGVLGRHGSLTHFLPWTARTYDLRPDDRFSMLSGIAHDPLQRDIFTPLCLGASLFVPSPEDFGPDRLAAWMRAREISVALVTPPMVHILAENREPVLLPALRRVFLTGDRLLGRHVTALRGLAPDVRIVNFYGATETQRSVAGYLVPDDYARDPEDREAREAVLPLGRGTGDGVQVLVLNRAMGLAGVDELGEIHIRGPHLAAGYLDDPDLTRARFLASPASVDPDDRIYKTGDLGRFRADGHLVFADRMDSQIKIRGFRVEPAEIEARLMAYPGVKQALVLARPGGSGTQRDLAAFMVPDDTAVSWLDDPVAAGAARRRIYLHVTEVLPSYMIPGSLIFLAQLPLTLNRKIDRKALVTMDWDHPGIRGGVEGASALPGTATERELVCLWEDLLNLSPVGVDDDFFILGGHSLLAVQLAARVRDRFGVSVALGAVFDAPRLSDFAEFIDRRVADQGGSGHVLPHVEIAHDEPRPARLPLSFSQERLFFLHRLHDMGTAYLIPAMLEVQGALDERALAQAFQALVDRHEALRTRFDAEDGVAYQIVDAPPSATDAVLRVVDLATEGPVDTAIALERARVELARPWSLSEERPIRAALYRTGEDRSLLLFAMQHIVSDGWSMGVLLREVTELYRAFSQGREPELAPLPLQYADYALWQRRTWDGAFLAREVDWWRNRLAGAPALLELPVDRPRPPVQRFHGAALRFPLGAELVDPLRDLGRDQGATLFMVLLGGFAALLSRWSGQRDVVIGTPVANRDDARLEHLIGFFVNTLALRFDLEDDPSVRQWVTRVRRTCLEALAHQGVPFERLVAELQPRRQPAHAPLFQVMFVFHNQPMREVSLPGLRFEPVQRVLAETKFDVTLSLAESESGGGLDAVLEYNTDIFDASSMTCMIAHLQALWKSMAAAPTRRLSALNLCDGPERSESNESTREAESGVVPGRFSGPLNPTKRSIHESGEPHEREAETVNRSESDGSRGEAESGVVPGRFSGPLNPTKRSIHESGEPHGSEAETVNRSESDGSRGEAESGVVPGRFSGPLNPTKRSVHESGEPHEREAETVNRSESEGSRGEAESGVVPGRFSGPLNPTKRSIHESQTPREGATRAPAEPQPWVIASFEARAAAHPDRPALQIGDRVLRYGELNAAANRLAHLLRGAGVGVDDLVALCLPRSPELLVGLLGILKAGAAYVPLDPNYPSERIETVLADSGATLMVTTRELETRLGGDLACFALDDVEANDDPGAADNPGLVPPADARAYVIYTSGSTGRPKGVAISHASLAASNAARDDVYGDPPEAFLLLSPIAFDSSVVGLYHTLCGGGTLVLPTEDQVGNVHALLAAMRRRQVTHTLCLPSLYAVLMDLAGREDWASLDTVIVAGEACPPALIERHRQAWPQVRLFNEYGPTEGTVWSSVFDCGHYAGERRVSVGRPLDHVAVRVLDAHGQPVPVGLPGELYLGGPGLARGYHGDPAKTAAAFVPDGFGTQPGARLYRTGDRVRLGADGRLDFLGRVDHQLKLRGYRIEPGEVETALRSLYGVSDAVVLAIPVEAGATRDLAAGQGGDLRLVAHVQPELGLSLDPDAMMVALRKVLPEYMVPAAILIHEVLPKMPNGKVDRKALRAWALPEPPRAEGTPPRTGTETELASMWCDLLGRDRIFADDHFFALGGHSLLAMRLFARIQEHFRVELTLLDLFREPVLRDMAELIDTRAWAAQAPEPSDEPLNDDEEEFLL